MIEYAEDWIRIYASRRTRDQLVETLAGCGLTIS